MHRVIKLLVLPFLTISLTSSCVEGQGTNTFLSKIWNEETDRVALRILRAMAENRIMHFQFVCAPRECISKEVYSIINECFDEKDALAINQCVDAIDVDNEVEGMAFELCEPGNFRKVLTCIRDAVVEDSSVIGSNSQMCIYGNVTVYEYLCTRTLLFSPIVGRPGYGKKHTKGLCKTARK